MRNGATDGAGLIDRDRASETVWHMKIISIRELHAATGKWVRSAAAGTVHVTERGRLVTKIVSAKEAPPQPFFAAPPFTRAFLAQRRNLRGGTNSTRLVSEERDRDIA